MVNEARHYSPEEVQRHLATPPGQIINIDEQCQQVFGILSYYCGVSHCW